MFFWVLNAILASISTMFWKKSLNISTVSPSLFFGIGAFGSTILSIIIIFIGKFEIPEALWILSIPFLDAFVVTYNTTLSQKIYKEEKISALLPYQNLSSVITIIIAFFLFRDTPLPTFLIAILVIAITFVFSFDFSKHEFPKKFKLILLYNGINGGRTLAIGYALAQLSSPTFYTIRNLLTTAIVWEGLVFTRQIMLLWGLKKDFLVPRLLSSWLGAISALIGFTLISELWLITSTLLGFLSMLASLVLGYFFLEDTPKRKDIMLAVGIAFLVTIGVFFKT